MHDSLCTSRVTLVKVAFGICTPPLPSVESCFKSRIRHVVSCPARPPLIESCHTLLESCRTLFESCRILPLNRDALALSDMPRCRCRV